MVLGIFNPKMHRELDMHTLGRVSLLALGWNGVGGNIELELGCYSQARVCCEVIGFININRRVYANS